MDSDLDGSVFSMGGGDESDGFVPEPKTKAKPAAAKKAAPKKLTQTTLKSKAAPKKRPQPVSDDESDGEASGFSNTPPSSKKFKTNPATKKSSGMPLMELENDTSMVDAPPKTTAKSKKTATDTYQKLTQHEHIMLRPDTYIGSVERTEQDMWVFNKTTEQMEFRKTSFVPGLFKIFDEILVNAADNKQRDDKMSFLKVTIDRDAGEISVENNGKGIPVEMHAKEKVYIPELIFGHLLAGSNFDDNEKKTVGGRNGFGAKLCNIFSTEFSLECQDSENGKRYKQSWTNNMTNISKAKITSNKTSDFVRVTFKPDFKRFGMEDGFDDDLEGLLYRRVYDMAGTTKGVKVLLNGEQIKLKDFKAYCDLYAKSIASSRAAEQGGSPVATVEMDKPDKNDKNSYRWQVGFTVSDGNNFQQVSFVNSIATTSGGTHVNYITDQITSSLLTHLNKIKKGHGLKQNHLKNYLCIFINCLIDNPAFNSQTKEQLTTKTSQFGSKCVLSKPFLDKIVKSEAIQAILAAADKKADKLLAKSDGNKRSRVSNAKLVEANLAGTRHGKLCTLILTEGDSAKGLAVSGRAILDPDRIGVFPLRGKMLNVRDASIDQITKNAEIQNIKQILGLKHKQDYKTTDNLRYGHLMIMADQDHDGSHIKGLLINLFQVQFPSLLQIPDFFQEFITPIVKVWQGSNPKKPQKLRSFFTQPEYDEWKDAHKNELTRWQSKYFKGLGTSSNEDAQVYFKELDQHLKQFETMKSEEAELFELAFSKKKADARKEWLGNFVPGTFLDHSSKAITYSDFVNKELILFSMADNMRSIPSIIDGFKPGQRKVLYACFKRNLTKDKKVVELAGYVSEQTAYHHGEASLQQTIIGLAQTYVGSNNINVLEPSGNFGSRLAGGSDAASPRYIFTRLSPFARKVFSPLDEPNLKHQMEDGSRIEPEVYAPILPMVLVNGADGIGTGWSTTIPNYHPTDIVRNLKRRMGRHEDGNNEELPFETMLPWFRGWKGTPEEAGPDRYKFNGIAYRNDQNPNEVIVTELPIRVWTDDFKGRLEKIISGNDGPAWIKDYKEFNDHKTVHFEIMVDEKHMDKVMNEGLLERFKLLKQVATSNLVAFDTRGQIRKYEKVEDIMEEYYVYRMDMYTQRKKHWLNVYHADYRKLKNQARFIQEIIDGDLIVGKKRKAILVQELRDRKYEAFPPGATNGKKSSEEEINESDDEADDVADGGARDYDYLLSMPIWSLTLERLEKLKEAIRKKKIEHDELLALTEKDLWCRDLDEFLVEWENQLAIDAEIQTSIRRMGRRVSKKIGAGRKGKGKDDDAFEPEKKSRAKPKAKAAPVKTESSTKHFGGAAFGAAPKVKNEPKARPVLADEDEFDEDDIASMRRSASGKAVQSAPLSDSDEQEVRRTINKRAAAKMSFAGLDGSSDSSDEDMSDLMAHAPPVKGMPAAEETRSRVSLFPSRPESRHGTSSALPKPKKSAKDFDFDSPDETNYEELAKSSPFKATTKDSDGDENMVARDEKPKVPEGLSQTKKAKPKPTTAAKPAAKSKTAARPTAKTTDLSPAAKRYASNKASKASAYIDLSDDSDAEIAPPAPKLAVKAAARGRPGRAAAAKKAPVVESSDSDPFEMSDD